MILAQLVLDLPNQEISPLNQHILGHGLVVGVLDLGQVIQLSGQLEQGLVCVHITEFEEVDTFLGENLSHANKVGI